MQIFGLTHSTQLRALEICLHLHNIFREKFLSLTRRVARNVSEIFYSGTSSPTLNFGMCLRALLRPRSEFQCEPDEGKSIEPSCDIYDCVRCLLETLELACCGNTLWRFLLNFGSIKSWMKEEESKNFERARLLITWPWSENPYESLQVATARGLTRD